MTALGEHDSLKALDVNAFRGVVCGELGRESWPGVQGPERWPRGQIDWQMARQPVRTLNLGVRLRVVYKKMADLTYPFTNMKIEFVKSNLQIHVLSISSLPPGRSLSSFPCCSLRMWRRLCHPVGRGGAPCLGKEGWGREGHLQPRRQPWLLPLSS